MLRQLHLGRRPPPVARPSRPLGARGDHRHDLRGLDAACAELQPVFAQHLRGGGAVDLLPLRRLPAARRGSVRGRAAGWGTGGGRRRGGRRTHARATHDAAPDPSPTSHSENCAALQLAIDRGRSRSASSCRRPAPPPSFLSFTFSCSAGTPSACANCSLRRRDSLRRFLS